MHELILVAIRLRALSDGLDFLKNALVKHHNKHINGLVFLRSSFGGLCFRLKLTVQSIEFPREANLS